MDAKSKNATESRQFGLRLQRLHRRGVVETEVGGQPGLNVADVLRKRLGDIGPLREPLSPPQVVLRNRMKLRQVESDEAHRVALRLRHRQCAARDKVWSRIRVELVLLDQTHQLGPPPGRARSVAAGAASGSMSYVS